MTAITRERLLKIQSWRETYGPGSNIVLPAEEAEELARIVLASLDTEPVAYLYKDGDDIEYNGHNEFSGGGKGVPLYAAPPTPVVPEEIDVNDPALDTHRKWMAEGWNACRAAMLQTGNSPVAPDDWVMVPKEPTEAMNKAGWAAMNEHDAINPTYRAMLAAAPQQEDK